MVKRRTSPSKKIQNEESVQNGEDEDGEVIEEEVHTQTGIPFIKANEQKEDEEFLIVDQIFEDDLRNQRRNQLFSSPKAQKYWLAIKSNEADFTSWTCLLQTIELENKQEAVEMAYDSFLELYPYCYGYWKKYADYEKKVDCNFKAKQIFERGVGAFSISVDLWIHYLNFTASTESANPDFEDNFRRLFTRAVEAAGREFKSNKLWDLYVDWEKSVGNLQNVTRIYDQLIATATHQYTKSWQQFREHLKSHKPVEVLSTEEYVKTLEELAIPPGDDDNASKPRTDTAKGVTNGVVTNDSKSDAKMKKEKENNAIIFEKIIKHREDIFEKTTSDIRKRWQYEDAIKRPYFHVKPLERSQLKNWQDYLSYEISEGNHEHIVILFERCLVACALYEDFWIKYLNYIQPLRVDDARDVYSRACNIHLRKKYNVHLRWAAFEEERCNTTKAQEILETIDRNFPGMVLITVRRAGLARRLGKPDDAAEILQNAADSSDTQTDKIFYLLKCARVQAKYVESKDQARETLWKGVELDKSNKRIYLQLLDLETQYGELEEERIEKLFDAINSTESLSPDFRERCWQRRVEIFEDMCDDVSKILETYDGYQHRHKNSSVLHIRKRQNNTNSESSSSKAPKLSNHGGDTKAGGWNFGNYGNSYQQFHK